MIALLVNCRHWTQARFAGAVPPLCLIGLSVCLASSCERIETEVVVEPERLERPNVLIVVWDAVRARNLSLYGYDRPTTPILERLGDSSAVFTRAHSQAPYTLPSVVSILTSMYPQNHGAYWKRVPGEQEFTKFLPEPGSLSTLPDELKAVGYVTAGIIGNPALSDAPFFEEAFDIYHMVPGWRNTLDVTEHGLDIIERLANTPWLLYLHYIDPHSPYTPPEPHLSLFASRGAGTRGIHQELTAFNRGMKSWTDEDVRRHTDLYDGELHFLDSELGRLLDKLRALQSLENTLIVITGDHGESLGEHDRWLHGTLYEECLHIPLVIRFPGGAHAGRFDVLAESIDIMPTALELLGRTHPSNTDGRALQQHISGSWDREISYAQYSRGALQSFLFSDSLKLIRDRQQGYAQIELFSLETDPSEAHDIADEDPELTSTLLESVDRWIENVSRSPGVVSGISNRDAETLDALRALGYVD
jgi:arylsulfatase A-like enzyme